jgi:hypothetical protein
MSALVPGLIIDHISAKAAYPSVCVFYPAEGVSDIQRKQMVTQRGTNVSVFGVRGNFDDCQTAVKEAFNDAAFNVELHERHWGTSHGESWPMLRSERACASSRRSTRRGGDPWQNGTDESFNGKLRDEYLSMEWFRSRLEATAIMETWRQRYNAVRPHSSLSYLTSHEFKKQEEQSAANHRGEAAL